jgi:hypothetical protein
MHDLLRQFDMAMFQIYMRAKAEAGYNATIFLRMISERGGLATAKYLISAATPSDGSEKSRRNWATFRPRLSHFGPVLAS